MVMEVSKKAYLFQKKTYLFLFVGQEVALYVKKYYCKELVKLASYKSKQYKIALEESFQKMDELMKTESGKKELNQLSSN